MAKKKPEDNFVRVTMHVEEDGVVAYKDCHGVTLAYKFPKTGTVADIRPNPPFLAMSPCPDCGVENDRGHNPLQHTDPFIGVPFCCLRKNSDGSITFPYQLVPCDGSQPESHRCSYFDVVTRKKKF